MKKINSKWYSIEKIKYEKHQYHYIKDPNGYLYVDSQYNTKITADDLPDWFVYGRFYKRFGYLSAKGVIDLYYIPNMWHNHMFKDDELVISYEEKIDKTKKGALDLWGTKGLYFVSGWEIWKMLKAIYLYSDIDIKPIIEQIKIKQQWYKENYPSDYERECGNFDFDEYFREHKK